MRKTKKLLSEIIEEFERIPIASTVCNKFGISRNTLYKWIKSDIDFRNKIEDAKKKGIDHIGDMAKSQIISKIQSGDVGMIKFWLRNNDPQYYTRKHTEEITFEPFKMVKSTINIPCKHDYCKENDLPRDHLIE